MAFECDPMIVLQNEILKTEQFRSKLKTTKKKRFQSEKDDFINDYSDQEFINDFISTSDFYPERD